MDSLPPGGWTARVTLIPQGLEKVDPAINARKERLTPPAVIHSLREVRHDFTSRRSLHVTGNGPAEPQPVKDDEQKGCFPSASRNRLG